MIISWKKIVFFCFSLILILPTLWPLFRSDFFRMHDFTHVARLVELNVALKDGQIPPRWASDFGWGYGMPLFHFYPPLSYYLAEIFYWLGLSAVTAIKLIFALNFLAGFWFMYLWVRQFWGKIGGTVAAVAFTYLPYRAVQFYVRGALAELMAMTFLPLFFYAAYKLIETRKSKFLVLTMLAITAVFLSHNVIALLAIFFFGLYFLFHLLTKIKYKKKLVLPWGNLTLAITAVLGAIVLSAFFIFPAFLEKDKTIVASIAGGFSYYKLHFVYLRQFLDRRWAYGGSVLGPNDDISFQIGLPHIFLAALAIAVFIVVLRRKNITLMSQLLYCFMALLLSVFMMTYHSEFIWDNLPILQIAQFPWRFLTFTGVLMSFLSGSIWFLIKSLKWRVVSATFAILAIVGLNFNYFKPERFFPAADYYYTDRQKIKTQMSDILFDYIPATAKKNPPFFSQPYQTSAQISDWREKTGLYQFEATTQEPTTLTLNNYYFPGWKVFVDQKESPINYENLLGIIEFTLPSGNHQIMVKLTKTPIQLWADRISLTGWLGLLGFMVWNIKIKKWLWV